MSFIHCDLIRSNFAALMSNMYREEVPAYGRLIDIVEQTNATHLSKGASDLDPKEDLERVSLERHGAIRLGTAKELKLIRRAFAVLGMQPVGYYDLSVAGIPVHSTAFRPVDRQALAANPFRVFTSLLRHDLIKDPDLQMKADELLQSRQILSEDALALIETAESQGGLNESDAKTFCAELTKTFKWHAQSLVDANTYADMLNAHGLIADIVCFKGPHINHLTPRTLNIDAAQRAMIDQGLPAKAIVEGPPPRRCEILLRQTSFKALSEAIGFGDKGDQGLHTARFGEIEQRGVALTPKGRALYDQLLSQAMSGNSKTPYQQRLEQAFKAFPDEWQSMHNQGLAYFRYQANKAPQDLHQTTNQLVASGVLSIAPIIYEDFLPISAAGIFKSNLADQSSALSKATGNQANFEQALGQAVLDPFALYQDMADQSLLEAKAALKD